MVRCPQCEGEFPITATDFEDDPEHKYCACIFCGKEFGVLEGRPRPPLRIGAS
jgi:hypothetical protein